MKRRALELAGIIRRYDLLKEGEDDTEIDDLFGDEGGDDEGGDDTADEEGSDTDEGGDEGGDEEEEEEEDPIETLTPDEIAKYGPGEIEKVLDEKIEGFFVASQKSATARMAQSAGYPGPANEEEEDTVVESMLRNYSLQGLLREGDEEAPVETEFDIVSFASDVHNLMSNYQTLLDMEGMIFNKAKQFLLNQAGTDAGDEFEELLALRHGWDPEEKFDISGSQNTMIAPPAAGAMTGGAPAA